jgi:D-sedoheptulose 7-phosphate isomerase
MVYLRTGKIFKGISLCDNIGLITAYSNDVSYEQIFEGQLNSLFNKGDLVIGISVSGNSKNILNAIEAANKLGLTVIGLTGKDGGKMAELCDVEIRAPHSDYADRAQEIHIKCIHSLIDYIEKNLD